MPSPTVKVICGGKKGSGFVGSFCRFKTKSGSKGTVSIRAGEDHSFAFDKGSSLSVTSERHDVPVVVKNNTTVSLAVETRASGEPALDDVLRSGKSITVHHNKVVKVYA